MCSVLVIVGSHPIVSQPSRCISLSQLSFTVRELSFGPINDPRVNRLESRRIVTTTFPYGENSHATLSHTTDLVAGRATLVVVGEAVRLDVLVLWYCAGLVYPLSVVVHCIETAFERSL